jgi:hypothetical protein
MIRRTLFVAAFAFVSSLPAHAASLARITTDGDLGNIAFQHLKMNAAGDFVGVSNSRVFAGSTASRQVGQIFAAENTRFVLSASTTIQVESPTGATNLPISVDVLSTRLALNAQGDFVLASNTRLFVGSARTGQVREVANAGAFADFQTVKLNDQGQYVAISSAKLFGGRVADAQATELLAEALGHFDVAGLYATQNYVDGSAADERLALNARGQFVAVTGSAVYVGDLTAMTVTSVMEERGIGFKHTAINDRGDVTVVTDHDVFVGTAN